MKDDNYWKFQDTGSFRTVWSGWKYPGGAKRIYFLTRGKQVWVKELQYGGWLINKNLTQIEDSWAGPFKRLRDAKLYWLIMYGDRE